MGGQQDESTYAPHFDNDLPPLHLIVVFPPILKYVIEYKESEASPKNVCLLHHLFILSPSLAYMHCTFGKVEIMIKWGESYLYGSFFHP